MLWLLVEALADSVSALSTQPGNGNITTGFAGDYLLICPSQGVVDCCNPTLLFQQGSGTVWQLLTLPVLARQWEGAAFTLTDLCKQGRWRMQKWNLPVPPSPERVSNTHCSSSRCFKIRKWLSFIYSLGTFQTSAFALGPLASENSHEPFKRRISVSCSHLGPLGINPIGFLSQCLGLVFPV